jgi:glucose-6-phosphate isomerase
MLNKWQQDLNTLAQSFKTKRLSDLFVAEPDRAKTYSLTVDKLYLDYSKNFIDKSVLATLIKIANERELSTAIERLMSGEKINTTENRPALHTALRQDPAVPLWVEGRNVLLAIQEERSKMSKMVHQLIAQEWMGATGKPIKHIVNLGIGGSDLGPKMVVQALKEHKKSPLSLHFVSNVDPCAMVETLERVDPATTLFVISSKSFTTPETLLNAQVAREWLEQHLHTKELSRHFIAVTSQPEKAKAWGISQDSILCFDEWVGGRYSVWSTIGFPVALSVGMPQFEAFLSGARAMDAHFKTAPFEANMPVLLALIGIWYIHGFEAHSQAILPYAHGLRRFADYLQQLDMESNGKAVQLNGESVSGLTGPIIWGQAGTNGQHAFYQLLHQGTHFIPVDFIVPAQTSTQHKNQHTQFIANCLAQAQALMQGCEGNTPHDKMPGNKPSNMLVLNELDPYALGQLLALYEHKVFVQGILWGINSFDQPGVELGKKLASKVAQSLESNEVDPTMDPSTRQLIQKIQSR